MAGSTKLYSTVSAQTKYVYSLHRRTRFSGQNGRTIGILIDRIIIWRSTRFRARDGSL